MYSLPELIKMNNRPPKPKHVWPKYGFTGDEQKGIHLRRDQTLLTFYIERGTPARQFLRHFKKLKTERGRCRYIYSFFPFFV